jgi:hypothetical protein
MKYIITNTERYEVEADSLEEAMAIYNVVLNDIEPEIVGLPTGDYGDLLEYLDGSTEAREAEKD